MNKLLILAGVLILAGCSSAPRQTYTGQYCYTDQTIQKNGDVVVSSLTTLECTDRPGQQTAIQRAGIDAGCEEFWYPEIRRGKIIQVRGVRCEKLNGRWEIVNIDGSTR
jgi:hypothetical protein